MTVLKSGGRRQPFERDKLVRSMQIALRKRPVAQEDIEKSASEIIRQLESRGETEVESKRIGEAVMKALARLDAVGYIRFASVYKDFCRPEDFDSFLDELKDLQSDPAKAAE